MNSSLLNHLGAEDDPDLWEVAMKTIVAELPLVPATKIEVGRCSHWLAPHKYRWLADGGFACPVGYGGGRYSLRGLPIFDWSMILQWNGQEWVLTKSRFPAPCVRIAIPSRTRRHGQAAIHTVWTAGTTRGVKLFGFRRKLEFWRLTASQMFSRKDQGSARERAAKKRVKAKKLDRRRLRKAAAAGL